ncbi:pseudaminic acid cytidylyltransferase [Pseudoalteromonas sp. PS1M3]|uniref:pseudaminic acid cytidylyltransferase n=1 Tax=Pseudoalteromonas sp. PS1M3 TaxID=87791 RepID=UPI0019526965|nr:pseudaminic acid cytidylyltransferase [Pseudoalteromonas sp. PS1M3]BBW92216.1 pseudaminic acid cytidylyltransferase [Pseudoalteromonas sp. PS1M3]
MNIAIIPARGGSKRIHRKNIKNFHGKPIIAYSIETARKSGVFDRIIVSTDDLEIAEVAKNYGAEVPFIRPSNLADDHTGTLAVLGHALSWLEKSNLIVDYICCIYATSPFLSAQALIEGKKCITSLNLNYAFSATEYNFPIQRAFYFNQKDKITMFQPEHLSSRSQDLTPAYHDAGQFYWCAPNAIKELKPFFSAQSSAILIPKHLVHDIDTIEDWKRAELAYKILQNRKP